MTARASLPPGARVAVDGVTVKFAGLVALAKVSFVAAPGTVHAVIGPNGAGKSTLFNLLSGVYRPVEGSVRLDEHELVGLSAPRIARLGLGRAFQNASMFAGLTVEENLLLGRHRLTRTGVFSGGLGLPRARREEALSRVRVQDVASMLGIEHLLQHPAAELPYGLQKRVDVARALCSEPRVILLDEPAAGMHTHEKRQMRGIIRTVADDLGITVLLVEHDMGLVMGISDHVTVLDFGTVIASAAPQLVQRDKRVIEAYLGVTESAESPDLSTANGTSSQEVTG